MHRRWWTLRLKMHWTTRLHLRSTLKLPRHLGLLLHMIRPRTSITNTTLKLLHISRYRRERRYPPTSITRGKRLHPSRGRLTKLWRRSIVIRSLVLYHRHPLWWGLHLHRNLSRNHRRHLPSINRSQRRRPNPLKPHTRVLRWSISIRSRQRILP